MKLDASSGAYYPEPLATRWLVWLARNLQAHGKTIFMIEELQPSWLEHRWQRFAYLILFSALFGFVLSWIFVLAWIASKNLDPPDHDLIRWWVWWLGTSLCFLVFAGAGLDTIAARLFPGKSQDPIYLVFLKLVPKALVWLIPWCAIWLGFELSGLVADCQRSHWLEIGGIVAFIAAARLSRPKFIETVEALGWSWPTAASGLIWGLVAGAAVWVLYAFIQVVLATMSESQIEMNIAIFVPIGGAGGAFLMGLQSRLLDTKTVPNEGMMLSLRNALRASLWSGPLMGICLWPLLFFVLRNRPEGTYGEVFAECPCLPTQMAQFTRMDLWDTLPWALVMGTVFGCIVLLWFGGLDLMKHYTLRLVISLTRQAPANFVRFLDYSVDDLNFLQRVGGGYMFIHRYLAEHFADSRNVPGRSNEH